MSVPASRFDHRFTSFQDLPARATTPPNGMRASPPRNELLWRDASTVCAGVLSGVWERAPRQSRSAFFLFQRFFLPWSAEQVMKQKRDAHQDDGCEKDSFHLSSFFLLEYFIDAVAIHPKTTMKTQRTTVNCQLMPPLSPSSLPALLRADPSSQGSSRPASSWQIFPGPSGCWLWAGQLPCIPGMLLRSPAGTRCLRE